MPVTIDSIPQQEHKRFAENEALFDRRFLEGPAGPKQAEIGGATSIYLSQWDELFEVSLRGLPWATFPEHPLLGMRRFFSARIMPKDSAVNPELESEIKLKAKACDPDELQKMIDLFKQLGQLDHLLSLITSLKTRFQRG